MRDTKKTSQKTPAGTDAPPARKLSLNRETLRRLDDQALAQAAGGTNTTGNCNTPATCMRSCVTK